jgi:hypothetical protein
LTSLISSSSRVVVNFFLPFIRWCLLIHGIYNIMMFSIFCANVHTFGFLYGQTYICIYVLPYVHMVGNEMLTVGSLFPRWSVTKLTVKSICYEFN